MTKPDIVMSTPTAQINNVKGGRRKYTVLPIFKGKCKEMKRCVLDVHGALSTGALSVPMHEMTELISRT